MYAMMATVRMASSWAPERRGIVFADSALRADEVGTGEMCVLRSEWVTAVCDAMHAPGRRARKFRVNNKLR